MKHIKIILISLGLGVSAWAGWEGYRYMADSLSEGAGRDHKRRVAVIGFSSETGENNRASAIVTERLTSEIASKANLEVIERGRLDEVLKEQKLGANGVVDAVTAKKIGNILGADAVVTGTVIELDDKNVEVNARLVDTQNARIIKAVSKTVKKDWQEKKTGWGGDFSFDMDIDMDAPSALLPPGFMEDDTCGKLSASDVQFVKMCVELKARKTAHALKTGALKLADIKKNPGAEIKDQDLKHLYYSKIKEWYYSAMLRALSPQEEAVLEQGAEMIEKYPCR